MTAWQRPTSLWRTSNLPQTFSFVVNGLHRFHGFIFCVICVICWLLSSNNTNCTKLLVSFVSFDDFLLLTFYHPMTRIARIISDISVICCFFFLTSDETDFTDCFFMFWTADNAEKTQKLYMIVTFVISYFCAFCVFCGFPHQRISRILVSFLHMFGNKLLSPESKTYELL